MWKLHRYIALTVLTSMAIVAFVMCGLYVIFTFVAEIGNVGQGTYGVLQAMEFVLLSMPDNIGMVLPIVGLLGSLMGLGLLAGHSELIAMRAAGVSIRKIAQGVVYASVLMGLLAFAIASYVGPQLMQYALLKRAVEMQGQAVLVNAHSTWLKQGNDFIFVGSIQNDGTLHDIQRYEINDGQLVGVVSADSAHFEGKDWVLQNVQTIHLSPTKITHSSSAQIIWTNLVTPQLLQVLVTQSSNLTLTSLWDYIQYRKANGLSLEQYQANFWQTFFAPLSVVILSLLAVPFVFGPLRSAHAGFRLIAGVTVGFVFFIINQFFGPFTAVYHFPAFLGAALPSLIFALLAGGMLWWVSRA